MNRISAFGAFVRLNLTASSSLPGLSHTWLSVETV